MRISDNGQQRAIARQALLRDGQFNVAAGFQHALSICCCMYVNAKPQRRHKRTRPGAAQLLQRALARSREQRAGYIS